MFEQTFKNIDDVLWKDAGCGSELDYVEQSSWVLLLKYLDDLEKERESAASLAGKPYEPILRPEYRWDKWAMPRKKDGEVDHSSLPRRATGNQGQIPRPRSALAPTWGRPGARQSRCPSGMASTR